VKRVQTGWCEKICSGQGGEITPRGRGEEIIIHLLGFQLSSFKEGNEGFNSSGEKKNGTKRGEGGFPLVDGTEDVN